jgi:hypothetical protein
MLKRLALLVGALLLTAGHAHAQGAEIKDTASGKCWAVSPLGTAGIVPALAPCDNSSDQSLTFDPATGNIWESGIAWGYCLREDTLTIDVCYSGYQEKWALVNGYVQAENGKALVPDANGNATLASTAGPWVFDPQTPPPPPPPPPPPSGSAYFGVAGPWDAAYHATTNPPDQAVWVTGPNGEAEQVWNVPQDYAYWENALGLAAGSFAASGGGIADSGGWSNYEGSAWTIRVEQFAAQRGPAGLWLNIPPFPDDVGATLAQAATGAYNAHYTAVAQQLMNGGYDHTLFRPIWEFTGGWYAWGYSAPGQDQANYCTNFKGAWLQMVTTIRAVMPNAKFAFNPNGDATNAMPGWAACYPLAADGSDTVVDAVFTDSYDGLASQTTPASTRWANDVQPTIDATQALALAHHKDWGSPEWAQGKMGDNPLFVTNMAAAMAKARAAGMNVYNGYWNISDPNSGYDGYMDTTGNPLSWAEYVKDFHQ